MRKIIQGLVLGVLLFGIAGSAMAADFATATGKDGNVLVGAAETHKNLYAVGGNVTVNGITTGDLTAAGGFVTVSGDVEKDLLLAGGTLNLSGTIGDNAKIAGGNIFITGPVKGDLAIAGGNINLTGKSSVDGDLLIAGGSITIDAPVKGNVKIAGGNVIINGKIDGSLDVKSGSLTFGSGADVAGNINYSGKAKAEVNSGAKVGNINFTEWQPQVPTKKSMAGFLTFAFLIKILAWMVAAWLLMHFKKSWVMKVSDSVQSKPWSNLGWGLVYLIAIPLAIILLFATLIGFYAALIVGAIFAVLLLVAHIFAALIAGFLIVKLFNKTKIDIPVWQPIVIGVLAYMIVSLIPFLGWIATAIIFLMTFGALVKSAGEMIKEK
ncbi:MAG: hypothetical protein PHE24_02795 [Patescibacteria group bacterium]|nr:hypothetical protein [Patescibacteria group bacterium]